MTQAYAPAETEKSTETSAAVPTLKSNQLARVGTLLFLALILFLSLYMQRPPAALPADAPENEFSAARALRHLEVISRKPHPMGTAEHAAVRDYISGELTKAGLTPEIQSATAVNHRAGSQLRAGTVNNVVARLRGTGATKAVMLVAHYDSAPTSQGASDDGSGVVTLLESLRALRAAPPLKNDVIFLFTDGEEPGLLGAEAFAAQHPWAKDAGVVVNFEARGNGGPAIMFETSDNNGWLIREFAKASPRPVASSLAYEIYRLLPNDTDLSAFKRAGMAGFNVAYIEGLTHYHTLLDSFDRINQNSLQHDGSYALALARHFGNIDLADRREVNAVYFDLFGRVLFHYSYNWVLPLVALITLLFVGLVVMGFRRKRLTAAGLGLGFLAQLVSAAVSAGIVTLLWRVVSGFGARPESLPNGTTYNGGLYLIGFVVLALAITSAVYAAFHRRVSLQNLTAGAGVWWVLLMIVTALYVPGASFIFMWPLLFGLAALAVLIFAEKEREFSPLSLLLVNLCAIPALVLVVPNLYLIFHGLTLSFVAPLIVLTALLFGLLLPQLSFIASLRKWRPAAVLAVVGLVLILTATFTGRGGPSRPKVNSIFYGLNADTGNAVWASADGGQDEWTRQFLTDAKRAPLPDFFQSAAPMAFLQSAAPATQLTPPEISLLDDTTSGDVRTVRLRLNSARQASVLSLFVDSRAEVQSVTVNGQRAEAPRPPAAQNQQARWSMRFYAPPAEGVELTAELKTSEPLALRVVDQTYGLPEIQNQAFRTRPAEMIPRPLPFTDSTLVSKSYKF
ncbi:MAG TPA: M20/M25/M40 family metallo-hydrolase [Pyrinomonadaceae bacterium]|nr:M20/M25/M40 family metallo-hydrolase [Pyrinomonadaceae bacterium]